MAMTLASRSPHVLTLPLPRAVPQKAFLAPVFLFFLGVILPSELAIDVFGLALFPVRLVLIAFFIPAVLRLLRAKDARVQSFDVFLLLAMAWLLIALIANNGFDKGIKFGGSLLLEALGGYVMARAYVRTTAQFAKAVGTYFLFVMITAAVAIPETFFGIQFAHDLAAAISGLPKAVIGSEPGRLGLARANSTFDHPILYGAFCASSLGLVCYLSRNERDRRLRGLAIGSATLCAVSSAPLLAYALIIAFILWEQWTRRIGHRVAITLGLMATAYALVELLSNRSAVEVFISLVALDHWTAYYRILIWQNATIDLAGSPWLGVPLNAWTRPAWMTGSVDSFWLNLALMSGLPTLAFLGLGLMQLLRRVHARRGLVETRQRWAARLGWTVTLLALCLQAFTVHYWGSMNALFFFLLGMGAWLAESSEGLERRERAPANSGRLKGPRAALRRPSKVGRAMRVASPWAEGMPSA